MLSIYRRHKENCKHAADRSSKKCHCSLWITGTLFGEPYRKTAKTRSWEAAQKIMRDLEDGKAEKTVEAPIEIITVGKACEKFMADCSAHLSADPVRKYSH